jgi:hypothetical protein
VKKHDPLVSVDLFNRAKERMRAEREQKTQAHSRPDGDPFLFSGMTRCGSCGNKMHATLRYPKIPVHCPCGQIGYPELRPGKTFACKACKRVADAKPGAPVATYVCQGGFQLGAAVCRCRKVTERELLGTVTQLIEENLLAPAKRAEWEKEVRRRLAEAVKTDPKELGRLRKLLSQKDADLERGRQNVLLAPAAETTALYAMLERWRQERESIAEQIAELEEAQDQVADVAAIVEAFMGKLDAIHIALAFPMKGSRPDHIRHKRELFLKLIDTVTVSFEDREHIAKGTGKPFTRMEVSGVSVHFKPDAWSPRNLVGEVSNLVSRAAQARSVPARWYGSLTMSQMCGWFWTGTRWLSHRLP